jgi:hypothetical protein
MELIDRRALTRGILFGAAAAAAGLALSPVAAMPLDDRTPLALDEWIEKTQVWVGTGPRRHRGRRVWRCWWRRGRRVCNWVWV